MFAASKTATLITGGGTDPQFNYVTMLLHGDGTNGAQNNTFIDSSSNNFTITRNGTPTQGSFSPYGANWSNYFGSGNSIYISTSSVFAFSGDFTVEAWVFVNNTSTSGGFDPRLINIGGGIDILFVDSSKAVQVKNSSTTVVTSSSNAIALNTWQHVAIVRSGSTVTIYVNGTSVGSASYSSTFSDVGDARIARLEGSGSGYLDGYISNLRIVKGSAVYTGSFTPSTTPLTAITNTVLLTCQSNRFVDNSSNNFTLTVSGSPSVQRFSPFAPSAAYSTATIGGSGYFNGTNDYLSAPSSSAFTFGTGDFTIEAWIYVNSTFNGLMNVFSSRDGAPSSGVWFGLEGSAFLVYPGGLPSVGNINRYSWVHLAASRQSSTLRLFIDGALVSTVTDTRNYTTTNGNVSYDVSNSGDYFPGYISNLRVVKGTAVYTSSFTPNTAPLSAVSGTSLLLNTTNAAIFDNAMMNDLATVGNAQISTSVVKYGTGSMAFDGSGDYLVGQNTPNISLPSNFTIEAWFYQTNAAQNSPQICIGDAANSGTCLLYIDTNQKLACYLNGFNNVGSSTASINTWHHVAVVRSGSTITTYLNGVSQSTVTTSTTLSGVPYFGASLFSGTFYYGAGYIDDLRITKGYARYTADFTPPAQAFSNN